MTDDYLRQRARRGSRAKYDAAPARVPDVELEAYDRLVEAVSRLDPDEERALAEEGLAADLDAWPAEDDDGLMEDAGLLRAIQEGEASPLVSRDDVFRALDPGA